MKLGSGKVVIGMTDTVPAMDLALLRDGYVRLIVKLSGGPSRHCLETPTDAAMFCWPGSCMRGEQSSLEAHWRGSSSNGDLRGTFRPTLGKIHIESALSEFADVFGKLNQEPNR